MAGRTSQAGRRSAAQNSARSARAEVARARRAANRNLGRSSSPLASLGFIGAGVAGLWMGLAHAPGWVVRKLGKQAATPRELDRAHQRDGRGVRLIRGALLPPAAGWFH